jgi:hypothetical protein
MGSVTARENIRWFVPLWVWFGLLIWVELRRSSPAILFVLFFLAAVASAVPFFCRRIGLLRLGFFGWFLPAMFVAIVIQILRTVFHLS